MLDPGEACDPPAGSCPGGLPCSPTCACDDLTADGAIKTVTSDWHWVGNLRLVDPDLVVLGKEVPGFAALLQEPAILIWLDKPEPQPEILDRIHQAGFVLDGERRSLRVPEFFGSSDGRLVTVVKLKRQEAK